MNHKCKLLILFMAVFIFGTAVGFPAHASSFSRNRVVYADPEGNIIFQSHDKKKSSSKSYKTIGVSIARCVPGNKQRHSSGDYIIVPFSFSQIGGTVVDDGNGYITSTYIVTKDFIFSEIQSNNPEWYAELQDTNRPNYLCIDCVMACYEANARHGYFNPLLQKASNNTYWNTIDSRNKTNGGQYPALQQGWASTSMFNARGSQIDILNHNTVRNDGSNTIKSGGTTPWSAGTLEGFRTYH